MKIKERKTIIVGMNGSGKTEFGKYLASNGFKRVLWVTVNTDDIQKMPKNIISVLMIEKTTKELNEIVAGAMSLARKGKIDGLVIDEADLFINNNADIENFKSLNELVILQRHAKLGVILMSRRPQNLPTMLYETSDNTVIFALPNSDNIEKKVKALDKRIPDLMRSLTRDKHNFITYTVGYDPSLNNPINLDAKKKMEVTNYERRTANNS